MFHFATTQRSPVVTTLATLFATAAASFVCLAAAVGPALA